VQCENEIEIFKGIFIAQEKKLMQMEIKRIKKDDPLLGMRSA